jgi:serine/threonine protein kinase
MCGKDWPDSAQFCGDDATPLPEETGLENSVVGHYRIVSRLGGGGMGTVYLGEHQGLRRRDAIKVLNRTLASDPDALARFHREARNASTIAHENVCRVYDFGETVDGLSFLAMELVEGPSVSELLEQEGVVEPSRAAYIAGRVADGLQAAHDRGIVHRDLKPGNIMVVPRPDGRDDVKVVDFGIAKAAGGSEDQEVTRVGLVAGTPEYMSPEHLRGEEPDPRSDVYSLGVVLYRMLTGKLPFTREHPGPKPMPLQEAHPGGVFPSGLQAVVDTALAHDPALRFQTAREMGQAVEEASRDLPPATVVTELRRPASRLRQILIVGGPALAFVGGLIWIVMGGGVDGTLVGLTPPDASLSSGDALVLSPMWDGVRSERDAAALAREVSWSTLDATVATVDAQGRVEGRRAGSVGITASRGSESATAQITVVHGPPSRVDLQDVILGVGETLEASASAFDVNGNTVEDADIRWRATPSGVVQVDSLTGQLRGLRAGSAELSVTVSDLSGASAEGRASVEVEADAGSGTRRSASTIVVAPSDATAVLARLYQAALSPPSEIGAQRAVRDTARAIYELGSRISDPERGAAAWILSNMLLWLNGSASEIDLWEARADSLGAEAFIARLGGG